MSCAGNVWAVDNSGAVNYYNIRTNLWGKLDYERLEFKRVSTTTRSAWAVGGDHQIYLYVPSSDIPIRLTSITYENERWNPINGFGSSLLPTDRPNFSSKDGLTALPKEDFKVPSKNWVWECEWYFEDNLDGEPLAPGGWSYAIDFPMEYKSEKAWKSLVRRRQWVRHKRYISLNRWTIVECLHGDHIVEPFIDVACGGYDIPGGGGHLVVWAVTVMSRVLVREGVKTHCPEGTHWQHIETPGEREVHQISVGPAGLVWAVSWDGAALVRVGVTRDAHYGTAWVKVESPTDARLMQVSVGLDAVWAVSRDFKVWFRKGVRGAMAGLNDMCATGSGWVEMVNKMSIVTVSPKDQVWGIGDDKKTVYFRTEISSGNMTGKAWKPINTFACEVKNTVLRKHLDCSLSYSSNDSLATSIDSSLTQEEEQSAWMWISASAANVNADLYVNDSNSSRIDQLSNISFSEEWRQDIMAQLVKRNEFEMTEEFVEKFPDAIEIGTWIKSGRALIFSSNSSPLLCQLELERHGVEKGTESGILACSYSARVQEKIVINLAEIVCVRIELNKEHKNLSNILVIHTTNSSCDKALKLTFHREKDLDDWFTTLNVAANDILSAERTLNAQPTMWGVTDFGAVYACYTFNEGMLFRHAGDGHFRSVETCAAGVTWAISHDDVAYCFSGGSGGGIYKSISGANSQVFPVEDTISFTTFENQRWNPLSGFAPKGLPTDRPMWSDVTGRVEITKDSVRPPSKAWQWVNDWNIDYTTPGGVDSAGWQYAVDFPFDYHPEKAFTDYARRRKWYRKCRLSTTGPWLFLDSVPIISVSLSGPESTGSGDSSAKVYVWAVAANGDVLCRLGVTPSCPKGLSWSHVSCNQKLKSISVGGSENMYVKVWAIAHDGSAFLRIGVTQENPIGHTWFQVQPPGSKAVCPLRHISVGNDSVFAVDKKRRLWYREEIVPTFPEGTSWSKVSDNVKRISVGGQDEYVVTLIKPNTNCGEYSIAKRTNVSDRNKIGKDWKLLDVNAFDHISVV